MVDMVLGVEQQILFGIINISQTLGSIWVVGGEITPLWSAGFFLVAQPHLL